MDVVQRQLLYAAINKLDDLSTGDPEASHSDADDIICEFLRGVGYGDAADAFDRANSRVGFWYAWAD